MIMAEQEEKKGKKKLKLRGKYLFMVSKEETMEPVVEFRINLLKLSLITLGLILVLMVITYLTIAYTPLREDIPG